MLRKTIQLGAVLLAVAAGSHEASAGSGMPRHHGAYYRDWHGGGFHRGWYGGRGLGLIAGLGLVGVGADYSGYDGYYAVPYYGDHGRLTTDCYERWTPTRYGWAPRTLCY